MKWIDTVYIPIERRTKGLSVGIDFMQTNIGDIAILTYISHNGLTYLTLVDII